MYKSFEYILSLTLFSLGICTTIFIAEYSYNCHKIKEITEYDEITSCLVAQISKRIQDVSYPWVMTTILEEIGITDHNIFSRLIETSKSTSHVEYVSYSLRITNETIFDEKYHDVYNTSITILPETTSHVKWPILFVYPFEPDLLGHDVSIDPYIDIVIATTSLSSDTFFSPKEGGIVAAQTVVIDQFQVGVLIHEYSIDGIFHEIPLYDMNVYIGLVSNFNAEVFCIYGTSDIGETHSVNINSLFDIIIEVGGNVDSKRGSTYITMLSVGFSISCIFSIVFICTSRTRNMASTTNLMTNFISQMSHSLRTPIQGIDGLTDILKGRYSKTAVRDIKACNDTMLTIVDDMLEMSRINAKIQTIDIVRFDLKSLLLNILESGIHRFFIESTSTDKVFVRLVIHENLPFLIEADRSKIIQVIQNLYSNALKFTKIGTVTIEVYPDIDDISIIVTDTGVGMTHDSKRKLFIPFERSHSDTRIPGTGLGLALSKKISDILGGKIICLKSSLGVGSVFKFTFPYIGLLSNSALFSHIMECDNNPIGIYDDRTRQYTGDSVKDSEDSTEKSLEEEDRLAQISGESIKLNSDYILTGLSGDIDGTVLVVDDVRLNRIIMKKMVEDLGLSVETCENGQECVDRCASKKFALILLDMSMPVMGGIQACKKIRRCGLNQQTCIIIITANTTHSAKTVSISAGANHFMTKPVDKSFLDIVITQCGIRRHSI